MGEVDWTALFQNLERQTNGANENPSPGGSQSASAHATAGRSSGRSAWEYEAAAALSSQLPAGSGAGQLQTAPPSPTHLLGPSGRPSVRRGNTLPSPTHSFSLPHTPQIPTWPNIDDAGAGPSRPRATPAPPLSHTANATWGAELNLDFGGITNPSLAEYIQLLSNQTPQVPQPSSFGNGPQQGWTGIQARTASGSGQSTPLGPPGIPLQTPPLATPQGFGGMTRGGSGSAGPSPPGPAQATPGELADSEDKRVRNTMASAKFRAKKKQHMETVQRSITDLEVQKVELERDVKGLKQENGLLREMVQMKYGFDMKDQPGGEGSGLPSQDSEDQAGGSGSGERRTRRKGNDNEA